MKIRPETFDILGIFVFPYIGLWALHALITGEAFSDRMLYSLLFIGIAGLIIDGAIVYLMFIKKRDQ